VTFTSSRTTDAILQVSNRRSGFDFNLWQTSGCGQSPDIWFPPDYGEQPCRLRAGLRTHAEFGKASLCQKTKTW